MIPLLWLFVGAVLGWLACVELGSSMPTYRWPNVFAGACGALAAGWLLSAFGPRVVADGELDWGNLVGAAFGAIVLLALVNLIRLTRVP